MYFNWELPPGRTARTLSLPRRHSTVQLDLSLPTPTGRESIACAFDVEALAERGVVKRFVAQKPTRPRYTLQFAQDSAGVWLIGTGAHRIPLSEVTFPYIDYPDRADDDPTPVGYPRELFELLFDYEGSAIYADVIAPWLEHAGPLRAWCAQFAARRGSPVPVVAQHELYTLYALSRIQQVLQFGGSSWGPTDRYGVALQRPAPDELEALMRAFGCTPIQPGRFTPLLYEIASVEQAADPDEPISLVELTWPGWMMGPMVFARAGVRVRGGRNEVDKEVAERSTMFWAYARKDRPASDLSHGWGHNSQWGTDFRRDLLLDGLACYHVDSGAPEPEGAAPVAAGLAREEARELVRHRCFVRTTRRDDDLWVDDLTLTEPVFSTER